MPIYHVNLRCLSSLEKKTILRLIDQTIESGDYILGKKVEQFEKAFAHYTETHYAVGVNSGTDALLLSLKALGIQRGDEVIIPTMTFIATAAAVIQSGAKPVFIDSQKNTPHLDPSLLQKVRTKNTKAIIPVHMNGVVRDMDEITSFANKHKLFVVEDACQAHGSAFKGKMAGTFGDIAAFSFYPSKNLGAIGDAGAVVTDKLRLYKKLLSIRNHGQKKRYYHEQIGWNSRMDVIQAIILRYKLAKLNINNKLRIKKANYYLTKLSHLPINYPSLPQDSLSNYHNFVILTKERKLLKEYLESNGIICGVHYPLPLHLQPSFKPFGYKNGDFPHAEKYARECLSLPMYPEITKSDQDKVISKIKFFFNRPA